MQIACGEVKLPVGTVQVAVSEKGICFVGFENDARAYVRKRYPKAEITGDKKALAMAADALKRWLAGVDVSDVPIDAPGTAFQHRVWQAMRRIPRGQTKTYKEIAEMVGSPKGMRAVGDACGANPVALLVPCHRVVASGGGLGGYAGGLTAKKRLLKVEGACA